MQLIHADCLEAMKDIPDGCVDMVMTDPPYGTTACKWDSIIPLEPMWEQLKRVIKPNGAIVMTASQPFTTILIASNMKMFKYELIWDKGRGSDFLNANRKPLGSHENICLFYSKLPTYNKQWWYSEPYVKTKNGSLSDCYGDRGVALSESKDGRRYPLSIIRFGRDAGSVNAKGRVHPTQKPVALMEYLIKTYTNEGEIVLDFTMGSGTTGVACVNLNRHFIGIEKDEKYFNIAKKRIEDAKGLF